MRAPLLRSLPAPTSPRPVARLPLYPHPLRQSRPTSTSTTTHPLSAKPHPIVSSFLCTGTEGTSSFCIALFKRSDTVRIYKNLHAGISGSIETSDSSPLAAALREINEETGLQPPLISLLRAGKVYDIYDEKVNKLWRIYTFLWRLSERSERNDGGRSESSSLEDGGGAKGGSGVDGAETAGNGEGAEEGEEGRKEKEDRLRALITLCDANTAVVFVRPEKVTGMDTVPDLERGVRAVVRGHFVDGLKGGGP